MSAHPDTIKPKPIGGLMDVPVPKLHVELPGGNARITVNLVNAKLDDLLEMLRSWEPEEDTEAAQMAHLVETSAVAKAIRRELLPVLAAQSVAAALALTRLGYSGSQMAHFLRISVPAFTKRFGTDKRRRALLAARGGASVTAVHGVIEVP